MKPSKAIHPGRFVAFIAASWPPWRRSRSDCPARRAAQPGPVAAAGGPGGRCGRHLHPRLRPPGPAGAPPCPPNPRSPPPNATAWPCAKRRSRCSIGCREGCEAQRLLIAAASGPAPQAIALVVLELASHVPSDGAGMARPWLLCRGCCAVVAGLRGGGVLPRVSFFEPFRTPYVVW